LHTQKIEDLTDPSVGFMAKNNKSQFLLLLIIPPISIGGMIYDMITVPKKELVWFTKAPIVTGIILLSLLSLLGYACYKIFFDNKIKLLIDNKGIWTPKHGQIEWQWIWYVYQKEIKEARYREQKLIIRLHNEAKDVIINYGALHKPADQIWKAIKMHAKDFDILFLEKETEP
jgi:hypothetical protein